MQEGGRDVNSLALATGTIARVRNTKASSIHCRISTILFHSGVKHDDLIRLNRMGICMSPDSIIYPGPRGFLLYDLFYSEVCDAKR